MTVNESHRNVATAVRLLVILTTVLGIAGARLPLLVYAWLWRERSPSRHVLGRMLASLAESLGPVATKLAQMASYRRDVFPPELVGPLQALQDKASMPSTAEVRARLDQVFGPGRAAMFSNIDEVPVAAGSIAFVCVARLRRSDEIVALKIRRANISYLVARDIGCLRLIVSLMARFKFFDDLPVLRIFDQIAQAVRNQCSLTREGETLIHLRTALCERYEIHIPAPFQDLSNDDVLVMQYVEHKYRLTDPEVPEEQYRQGCRLLLNALYGMIFDTGIVHCDFHPGNVLQAFNGKPALIDAGLAMALTAAERANFRQFFLSFAMGHASGCARAILASMEGTSPEFDEDMFRASVAALVDRYHGRRAGDFFVAQFVFDIFNMLRQHGVRGAPGFVGAIWALVMFEGLVRSRYPGLDFQGAARPFFVSSLIAVARSN